MKRTDKARARRLVIEKLQESYHEKGPAIRQRLREFSSIAPEEYFYELVYCLLTPQSSALNAGKAVAILRTNDLQHSQIDPEPLLHQKEYYIRFHRTKAKHLLAIREQYSALHPHLVNGSASPELRSWLVAHVMGLGWKEASHFLRNIGHRNLAILDRHILRNLVRAGVLGRLPKTLTAKRYLTIERKFKVFSDEVGIPMDELDLLFWSMETGVILK